MDLNEIGRKLQEAIDNPSPEGKRPPKALEVFENKLKQNRMETNQTTNGQTTQSETKPAFKYDPKDIDWASLEKLNMNRDLLENNRQLDKLLKGH